MGTLLGTMILLWVVMLHIPRAIADPYREEGNEIVSAARALAESGAAFLVAYAARAQRKRIPSVGTASGEPLYAPELAGSDKAVPRG